jgi:hypothetical protein
VVNKIKNFLFKYHFILGIFILVFIIAFFIIKSTFSEDVVSTVWDGSIATSFNGGSGTQADPYKISNGSELAYFF